MFIHQPREPNIINDNISHTVLRVVLASFLELQGSSSSLLLITTQSLLVSVAQSHPTLAVTLQNYQSTHDLQNALLEIVQIVGAASAIIAQNKATSHDDVDAEDYGIFQVFDNKSADCKKNSIINEEFSNLLANLPLEELLAKFVKPIENLKIIEQTCAALILASVRKRQQQSTIEQPSKSTISSSSSSLTNSPEMTPLKQRNLPEIPKLSRNSNDENDDDTSPLPQRPLLSSNNDVVIIHQQQPHTRLEPFPSMIELSSSKKREDKKTPENNRNSGDAENLLDSINNLSVFKERKQTPLSSSSPSKHDNNNNRNFHITEQERSFVSQTLSPLSSARERSKTNNQQQVVTENLQQVSLSNTNSVSAAREKRRWIFQEKEKSFAQSSTVLFSQEELFMQQIAGQVAAERINSSRIVVHAAAVAMNNNNNNNDNNNNNISSISENLPKSTQGRRIWQHATSKENYNNNNNSTNQSQINIPKAVSQQFELIHQYDWSSTCENSKEGQQNDALANNFFESRNTSKNLKLQETAFLHWWQKTATKRCVKYMILKRNFSSWRRKLQFQRNEANIRNVILPRQMRMRCFNIWKRKFQRNVLSAQISVRRTHEALLLWRRKTRQVPLVKALVALRAFHLASRAFQTWSAKLRFRRETRSIEKEARSGLLLSHVFVKWKKRLSEKQFEKEASWICHEKPVIKKCLERWLLQLHSQQANRFIAQKREISMTKQMFSWWVCRTKERQNEAARKNAKFEVLARRKLLMKAAFATWNKKFRLFRFVQEKNSDIARTVLMNIWRRKALERRHSRVAAVNAKSVEHKDGNSISLNLFAKKMLMLQPPVELLQLQQRKQLLEQKQKQREQAINGMLLSSQMARTVKNNTNNNNFRVSFV